MTVERGSLMFALCLALVGCGDRSTRPADRSPKAEPASEDAAGPDQAPANAADGGAPKVVLIIADDLGVDALSAYADISGVRGNERSFPATPTLDAICSSGVRFTEVWATPTCTPTRGSILTGSHGFRTGLDGVGKQMQIRADAATLPRVLAAQTQARTANIGKWHLGHGEDIGGLRAPNELGWEHYAGAIDNLEGYFEYAKVVDGRELRVSNYATTETVDDALAWIGEREADDSWLLWLAFNAPHGPFHAPPEGLHGRGAVTDPAEQYDAMVEALDREIGRLRASLPGDVVILFMGDNGTPPKAVRKPHDKKRAKGTLYQGGIHVPLCIAGAPVSAGGRSVDALVSSVDLFATMAELMGVTELPAGAGPDSRSLVPYLRGEAPKAPRTVAYSEQNRQHERKAKQVGGRTIRDARYKLIVFEDGSRAFYDLEADPLEERDLIGDASVAAARERLEAQLEAL